ncbi:hypothetical protein D8674_005945 [Pyrus ussuriensis x Pyrus communis]|uniref:Uncharacterized protein n=1 Tax=Pyrus ussuriensis x Pyrus communis TaxID=2448454 RepID=A0A5N5FSV4_9ROSA|nr:hypothetical protein D8674_005945 [Pyrus ussuriensis x Pyrus communis]
MRRKVAKGRCRDEEVHSSREEKMMVRRVSTGAGRFHNFRIPGPRTYPFYICFTHSIPFPRLPYFLSSFSHPSTASTSQQSGKMKIVKL